MMHHFFKILFFLIPFLGFSQTVISENNCAGADTEFSWTQVGQTIFGNDLQNGPYPGVLGGSVAINSGILGYSTYNNMGFYFRLVKDY